MTVQNEFPRTRDMHDWRIYSLMGGDRGGRFAQDFFRDDDQVKPAPYE